MTGKELAELIYEVYKVGHENGSNAVVVALKMNNLISADLTHKLNIVIQQELDELTFKKFEKNFNEIAANYAFLGTDQQSSDYYKQLLSNNNKIDT